MRVSSWRASARPYHIGKLRKDNREEPWWDLTSCRMVQSLITATAFVKLFSTNLPKLNYFPQLWKIFQVRLRTVWHWRSAGFRVISSVLLTSFLSLWISVLRWIYTPSSNSSLYESMILASDLVAILGMWNFYDGHTGENSGSADLELRN